MATSIDSSKLSHMIKSKRGKQGLRTTAKDIGISAPTLSRIEQGNLPDIDTYVKNLWVAQCFHRLFFTSGEKGA